ncbi:MAG: SLC13 family permease [Caldisericota bacterium]|nr:SLC13 family permease [Caldisericota bacterium]
MTLKFAAGIIFITVYLFLILFPKKRHHIAIIGAVIFIILSIVPLTSVALIINWNVLGILLGTMGVVTLLIESRIPSLLGDIVIDKVPNVKMAIFALALFAGFISAFTENVSTLLLVAPIAFSICERIGISPVPAIISIAVSANLQGAATLVGDPTSMLLAGYAHMNFLDFFWYNHHLSIAIPTEIGALAASLVLLYIFRKETHPIRIEEKTVVTDWFPGYLALSMVGALILASFLPFKNINGLICVTFLVIGVAREILVKKYFMIKKVVQEIDWDTILLLAGLFIIVQGLVNIQLIKDIARFMTNLSKGNIFLGYTIIVWGSVLASAFIDNIPYVIAMLPIVGTMSVMLKAPPELFLFGLLIGATLGGNITPIGASTNIAATGLLQKKGHIVSFKEFTSIGLPFTVAAVATAYIALYLIMLSFIH